MRRPNVRGIVRLTVVAVIAVVLFVARAPLARGVASGILDAITGDRVSMSELGLTGSALHVAGLVVTRADGPFFAADDVDVRYDLHDLVFGGGRRYGISRVALVRPRLTVIRHADGSFNLSGTSSGATGTPGETPPAPLALAVTIRAGTIALEDPFRALPDARVLTVAGIDADASIDTAGRSAYRGTGRVAGDAAQTVAFAGRFASDGTALHRVRAARVDLPPIVDYFINAPSASVARGTARNLDVALYAFPQPGGAAYHVAGSARIADGSMRVPGLVARATGMNGRLDVFDDGIAAPDLRARLGGISVRVAGGLFGWSGPRFRLGIVSRADLADLRRLFRFSRALPLAGTATLSTLLEGPVGTPLVATRVDAPALAYGRFPVVAASGRAIYHAGDVDVVGARGSYAGIAVAADGSLVIGERAVSTRLVVDAAGPAARVPYAAQIAPAAMLHATALLTGEGITFDARGFADGAGGGVRVAAPFHVDPAGDGAFGPVAAVRDDGATLAGTFYLDRAHARSGFWLAADRYPFADLGAGPSLPGLALRAPVFAGRLDGLVAGAGPPSAFRLAGRVRARDLRIGSVRIDDVTGDVAGALGNLRLGGVAARGAWGTFAGAGAYAAGRLALDGTYAGSFERLRAFTGDVGGTGAIDGPVALLVEPGRTVVQTRGSSSAGARVRGFPIDAVAGTIAVAGRRLRVYAATARVAGGDAAAAGALASADGVGVSIAGVDLERTAGIGGVRSGRASAIGSVSAASGTSRFAGGVALADSRYERLPIAADGDVTFDPAGVRFRAIDAVAGDAYLTLDGTARALAGRSPVYDARVRFPSVPLGPLAAGFAPDRRDVAGTLAGDLRVRGSVGALAIAGTLAIPEGTLEGLAFSDASADVAIDPAGVRARRGRVTVGSTHTTFAAAYRDGEAAIRVNAPHADLSDFNDLFDAGDTLGGRGRVAFRFAERGHATRTNADIEIANLRYRRFDLGDARAQWASSGRNVRGAVRFGGVSGRLAASGVLVLPRDAAGERLLQRSRFDGTADLDSLDLGVWLPALGYSVPIDGRVDARATIAGPLGNPAVTTTATLRNGSIGKFPVDRFTVSASSTLDRTTIRHLDLDLPSISIVGSGNFGLADRSPVAFALRATSPNIGLLSTRLFGASYPLTGAADLDVTIDGTRANPRLAGKLDVARASLHGVLVPTAHAAFGVRGRDVMLSDASVDFAAGSVRLDGSVPFEIAPFSLGPPEARVALTLAATDVELADFAPLLPSGSQLRGRVDGTVTVAGTAGAPRLAGRLALAGGSFLSPLETVPLTNASAVLSFAGNAVQLDSLHASAGGGVLDASGSTRLADLRPGAAAAAAFDFVARADKLRLDLPAYGSGTVDGTVSYSRIGGATPAIAGDLRLSDGTIPFSALLLANGSDGSNGLSGSTGGGFDAGAVVSNGVAPTPASRVGDLAFNLDVSALKNVRVRSANVDIGARGDLHVGGTRSAPELDGGFVSTGGTITYFNTVFRLVDGTVTFVPDAGLIPTLSAHAVTHVIDPDPNTVRNLAGTADVTLALSGPVTNLTIGLSSDPAYERAQILGLLLNAPALGASNLFGETRDQATLYGSNGSASLPPGVAVVRSSSGELSVAQEAFGVANAQFTRTLLAPIETSFAQAVGLSNFNVNVDYTGTVGVSARKVLGKQVNAIYGSSFGYPYRQTFGFELRPNDVTAAQVTVFQTLGANGLNSLTPVTSITSTSNAKLSATQPSAGTAGFSLSLQHLF